MNLQEYGFDQSNLENTRGGIPARILATHRNRFEIISEAGTGFAHVKKSAYQAGNEAYPTTGDFVIVEWQEEGESRIVCTLPRSSYFSRRDPSSSGYGEQAIAANFDYVFIMQSLDHDFNERRLERYLTLAWQSGAIPAIILTKADTTEDHRLHIRAAERIAPYTEVIAISNTTGFGFDRLEGYLKPGKTTVLLGSSGVGKSSFVNALAHKTVMRTENVREKDGRGKHTTSHRQLIMLDNGAMVIDTPGMRELGMWKSEVALEQSFADIEHFLGQCRFSDCRHMTEPGCAIKEALQTGALSQDRWESYLKLSAEARYSEDKESFMRDKERWHKEISLFQRQLNRSDYRHQPCPDGFTCQVCGKWVSPEDAGSAHRNHCPHCLSSVHVDKRPGDRASLCRGIMEPISVWVKGNGEWALIHRCSSCGTMHSNRIAADDDAILLMSLAEKPMSAPPFPA